MRSSRPATSGFTLMEAVAAVAAIAVVAIPIASAITSNLKNQKKIATQIAEHEFAYSLMETIGAERKFESSEGVYKDRFAFTTTVKPIATPTANQYSDLIAHIEITVHVDDVTGPGDGFSMRRIFAKKRVE